MEGIVDTNDEVRDLLERAREESREDPDLHAAVLAQLGENTAVIRVEQVPAVESAMAGLLQRVPRPRGESLRKVLFTLAWARALRGEPIEELCREFERADESAYPTSWSPWRIAGQRLVWRGEIERARSLFGELLRTADERGEPYPYALQRLHMCELELRIGRFDAAARLLDAWAETSERVIWPMYERCQALLAAERGLVDEADHWAARAIAGCDRTGMGWDRLEALRARGLAALVDHDAARAAVHLRAVWEYTQGQGIDDPGVFPAAPDLVEALVELDEVDEATAVAERLAELAVEQKHPWGLATAARCRALIRISSTYDEGAAARLSGAAAEYGRLGLQFDEARALLSLGGRLRRLRKWGAGRAVLERSVASFNLMGAPGWSREAADELARLGAKRPGQDGSLTASEERIVRLAAAGLSNKEIAAKLVVSPYTVEKHLSHAYAKLGLRSRTQLAAALR